MVMKETGTPGGAGLLRERKSLFPDRIPYGLFLVAKLLELIAYAHCLFINMHIFSFKCLLVCLTYLPRITNGQILCPYLSPHNKRTLPNSFYKSISTFIPKPKTSKLNIAIH